MMFWFSRSGCFARPITAREADRNYRDTDAGLDDEFVVQADKHSEALDGAKRWIAARADEDELAMPEGLHLEERTYRPGKTYMTLRVE